MEFNFLKKALIASTTCIILIGCSANEPVTQNNYESEVIGQSANGISELFFTSANMQTLQREDGSMLIEFPGIQAFSFDGADISRELQSALTEIASVLVERSSFNIQVLGHTDNVGNVDYNHTLSENRARQVANFLIQQGILPDRITSIGMGPTSPIADNRTAQGRAANRRVELVITD